MHCLREHVEPRRLEFLPYHFLLGSVGRTGYVKYTDISTGQLVAEMGSKLGACDRLDVRLRSQGLGSAVRLRPSGSLENRFFEEGVKGTVLNTELIQGASL